MKKKYLSLLIILPIIIGIFYLYKNNYKESNNLSTPKEEVKTSNSRYAIYIENNSGDYELSRSNAFPGSEYILNREESYCENGTTLEWDEINNTLLLNTSTQDKCFIYFDITFAGAIIELSKTRNHIIHHNGTITPAVAGIDENDTTTILDAEDDSYRYAGSNEIVNDNWVCFGYARENESVCSAANFATSEYAYRIIGVFKDVDGNSNDAYYVKLIKATSYKSTTNNVTTWNRTGSGATIQNNTYANSTLLNGTSSVLNGTSARTTIVPYTKPGGSYGDNETDKEEYEVDTYLYQIIDNGWNNYIAQPVWNVGGCSPANCKNGTAKTAYIAEMTGQGATATNNTNKIGLMYVNDYAYAEASNYWTTVLGIYDSEAAAQDWLISDTEWTISCSGITSAAFGVYSYGRVFTDHAYDYSYVVRPVLYLSSNIKIDTNNMSDSNMGTISNPYRLSMN